MKKSTLHEILTDDALCYQIITTPVGRLILISDNINLKAIVYEDDREITDSLRSFHKKTTNSIEIAKQFFTEYFKKNNLNAIKKINLKKIPFALTPYSKNEQKVLSTLINVPFGSVISYKDLSETAGYPKGSRFTGNVMAKNLFPIIIPCHRVIKSDGSPGNYSGGVDKKIFLLSHEGIIL